MAATAANLVFDTSSRDRVAAIPGRLRETFRSGRTLPIEWRLGGYRAFLDFDHGARSGYDDRIAHS